MIKSVMHHSGEEYSIANALFCALKGEPQPFDLAFVQTHTKRYHSFLVLGWGLVADIDLLSESMRWMGELRLHVAALYFIMNRQIYAGRLSVLSCSTVKEPPNALPPLGTPLPADWDVIQGEFVSIFILQTSHCAVSMHSSPGSTLDDGIFTIQVVQTASRYQMLQLLLSFDSGDHINNPLVRMFKAFAYRLEPLTSEGRFTLDGELVEYGPIQGVILPNKATTFQLTAANADV